MKMTAGVITRAALMLLCATALLCGNAAHAVLANAWHIPDNVNDLGFTMRNPQFEMGSATTVTIYQGVQKYGNSYGRANQTGGTLFYKGITQATWNSVALSWHQDGPGNNQYWKSSFNSSSMAVGEVIQYYLYLTFSSGAENTYVYGGDAGSATAALQTTAATRPFTIRNRPAWLYHNANRSVSLNTANPELRDVTFLLKMGYVGKDGQVASRWADNAVVYWTTDGSAPVGSLGYPSNTTQVAAMTVDQIEADSSPAGNALGWKAAVVGLPGFVNVRYRIGAWHSSNQEEKFADYKTAADKTTFSFTPALGGVLTINGVNGDYTTTHVFVDEVMGTTAPITALFTPNGMPADTVQVYSSLNRRDRASLDADGDGIEDGIVPPDGNILVAEDDSHYFKAYAMQPAGQGYALTLNAEKTGAYRLTVRYKVPGRTNWFWYTSEGRRDHAIVVSPARTRDVVMYELNALNIGAQGTLETQRSTFADLHGGAGARPYDPVANRINLDYARNLGVNWLWFQPVHPIGVDGRQLDPANNQPYQPGSPYSVKNFFQINPLLAKANTRDTALQEFTNFVAAADNAGVSIMLDAAFNHTAWDCELDNSGVYYFAGAGNSGNWQPWDEIRNRVASFFSLANNYCSRATSPGNIAVSPDRGEFGKWYDVHDVFFGRYAALVCVNPDNNGAHLNEQDWFDYTVLTGNFDAATRNVWRYFSDYVLYWLDKTGCPVGTGPAQTFRGIDGLRADFGQGLPPQCWEYIINKARSRKWDFVFMSESLDGGPVTYRSNRHFDMLNENIVFALKGATTASAYRGLLEERRQSYGQSVVLLNTTSHDEEGYDDPYQALIRYAAIGTVDGAPMIFYGQELGTSRTFGFDQYEINFGKLIPHFKRFNSLQPVFSPANRNYGLDQLWQVYAAINQARGFSKALRSPNRYFLNQKGSGGPQENIFSVAKYESAGGAPNFSDVVFAFVNLDRDNNQQGNFDVSIVQNNANLFGIKANRTYSVKNIAAYLGIEGTRRDHWLIPGNVSGNDLLNNGLFVRLKRVPASDAGWATDPFEAQYLKLYDVTPPRAPPTPPSTAKPYSIDGTTTFTWTAVTDNEAGVHGYRVSVGTTSGASNVFDGTMLTTQVTVTNGAGETLCARVRAISLAGIESAPSPDSAPVAVLDPAGDPDGDGVSSAVEHVAGTNPLDGGSVLKILGFGTQNVLTWSSVSGRTYSVFSSPHPQTGFAEIARSILATNNVSSFTDPSPAAGKKFYKVKVLP